MNEKGESRLLDEDEANSWFEEGMREWVKDSKEDPTPQAMVRNGALYMARKLVAKDEARIEALIKIVLDLFASSPIKCETCSKIELVLKSTHTSKGGT